MLGWQVETILTDPSESMGCFENCIFMYEFNYYTHPDTRAFHPVLAIWIVSLPMYDLLAVILRRTLIKKNPFSPDKKHIHHILLNQGFSSTTVLLILLILSLITNISGFSIFLFYGPLPSLLAFPFGFLLFCASFLT